MEMIKPTKNDVTREMFAEWSFERDRNLGLIYGRSFHSLLQTDKEAYLEEADYYLSMCDNDSTGWPVDILERLAQ